MGSQSSKVTGGHWSAPGQTRTSSLGAARPLPPSADIGPGGHSDGQGCAILLVLLGASFGSPGSVAPGRLERLYGPLRLDPERTPRSVRVYGV